MFQPPAEKATVSQPGTGQPVPAWPGPATCSAERAGTQRQARKSWWGTEGIVMARKLNCNVIRIRGSDFSSFLTGHSPRCLFLAEFKSVLQGAGQAGEGRSGGLHPPAPHFLNGGCGQSESPVCVQLCPGAATLLATPGSQAACSLPPERWG